MDIIIKLIALSISKKADLVLLLLDIFQTHRFTNEKIEKKNQEQQLYCIKQDISSFEKLFKWRRPEFMFTKYFTKLILHVSLGGTA